MNSSSRGSQYCIVKDSYFLSDSFTSLVSARESVISLFSLKFSAVSEFAYTATATTVPKGVGKAVKYLNDPE